MKNKMKYIVILLVLVSFVSIFVAYSFLNTNNYFVEDVVDLYDENDLENGVEYRFVFETSWSEGTHNSAYPNGAHLSPLVGLLHNNELIIWEEGGISSDGMELMAETGSRSILNKEINNYINSNKANKLLQGNNVFHSPGKDEIRFIANEEFNQITIVSMIAPSPDWFVGIHNFELYNSTNGWIENTTINLFPYDAGTDDGIDFNSRNKDTNPRGKITKLVEYPFNNVNKVPIGTFYIELIK